MQRTSRTHARHHRTLRGRILRGAAGLLASLGMAAGLGVGAAGQAAANPMGSLDSALTATGQPGPHRVPGHYFTSPTAPAEQQRIKPRALLGPSTPIMVGDSICTLSVTGIDAAGNKVGITAAHCGVPGSPVRSLDAPEAGVIGKVVKFGNLDYSVIRLRPDVQLTRNYGRVALNRIGGPAPAVPNTACKTGVATGTKCGPVLGHLGQTFVSHICASLGDSGAPVYAGGRLVGILNGGFQPLPSCTTPLQGPLHSPAVSTSWDAIAADMNALGGSGAGFRLP